MGLATFKTDSNLELLNIFKNSTSDVLPLNSHGEHNVYPGGSIGPLCTTASSPDLSSKIVLLPVVAANGHCSHLIYI